jgi:hypothetical protein
MNPPPRWACAGWQKDAVRKIPTTTAKNLRFIARTFLGEGGGQMSHGAEPVYAFEGIDAK